MADKKEKAEALSPAEKIKRRKFWLEFGAWALAIAVLLSAVIYLNFFDKKKEAVEYNVGDRCPDIVLDAYRSKGAYGEDGVIKNFSSMENKGTVMVINFWYTTCDPCVAELPAFEKVRAEFGDSVVMVAVHSHTSVPAGGREEIQKFIDNRGWNEYGIIFVQDTREVDCYGMLAHAKQAHPVTVIVNKSGYIAYHQVSEIEEDELRSEIAKYVNE